MKKKRAKRKETPLDKLKRENLELAMIMCHYIRRKNQKIEPHYTKFQKDTGLSNVGKMIRPSTGRFINDNHLYQAIPVLKRKRPDVDWSLQWFYQKH